MTRLDWSALGERFYETGIDRGVLYVDGQGVAWPGLVSVSESPRGGDPKAYYIDGYKYLNVAAAEEYEATLSAFFSPPEFDRCDGTASVDKGLFATQQRRKSFGLAYRTRLGNDTDGAEHAYKIHLVYGALAAPSAHSYSTLASTNDVSPLQWRITTKPPQIAGFKPTAHFVIDSRQTPRGLLLEIEDILYGSDSTSPRLPTVLELLGLFQSEGPVTRRNMAGYPAFRKVSVGTIEIRRNRLPNPSAETDTSYWHAANCTLTRTTELAASGAAAFSLTATANGTMSMSTRAQFRQPVSAGNTYAFQIKVLSKTVSRIARIDYVWETDTIDERVSGYVVALEKQTSTTEWTQLGVIATAPTGATRLQLVFAIQGPAAGETHYFDAAMVEAANYIGSYFDGDTLPANGLTYGWSGTGSARLSLAMGEPVVGVSGFRPYRLSPSGGVVSPAGHSINNSYIAVEGDSGGLRLGFQPGKTYTVSAEGHALADDTSGEIYATRERRIIAFTKTPSQSAHESYLSKPVPIQQERPGTRVSVTFTVPPDANEAFIRLYNGSMYREVRWFDFLVEETSSALPYFDGSTADADNYFYRWEGVADASTSVVNSWH